MAGDCSPKTMVVRLGCKKMVFQSQGHDGIHKTKGVLLSSGVIPAKSIYSQSTRATAQGNLFLSLGRNVRSESWRLKVVDIEDSRRPLINRRCS